MVQLSVASSKNHGNELKSVAAWKLGKKNSETHENEKWSAVIYT